VRRDCRLRRAFVLCSRGPGRGGGGIQGNNREAQSLQLNRAVSWRDSGDTFADIRAELSARKCDDYLGNQIGYLVCGKASTEMY
jgi:hypothetical protein